MSDCKRKGLRFCNSPGAVSHAGRDYVDSTQIYSWRRAYVLHAGRRSFMLGVSSSRWAHMLHSNEPILHSNAELPAGRIYFTPGLYTSRWAQTMTRRAYEPQRASFLKRRPAPGVDLYTPDVLATESTPFKTTPCAGRRSCGAGRDSYFSPHIFHK